LFGPADEGLSSVGSPSGVPDDIAQNLDVSFLQLENIEELSIGTAQPAICLRAPAVRRSSCCCAMSYQSLSIHDASSADDEDAP
jgi:hypothetical protein